MFSKRMILVAVVIVLVAVNVIILTITGKHTQTPSGLGRGALLVISPVQRHLTAFVQSLKGIWKHYFFLVSTVEDNQRLKAQLQQSQEALNHCSEATLANQRLSRVKAKHPKAQLVDADDVNVIYLVTESPGDYYQSLMASAGAHGVTRHMALKKMVRPFRRVLQQLA